MSQNIYPVGIQDFAKLREKGLVYVDKTASLYPLIEKGGFFFLSRPRRFGKSLMISTLEAYYEGRRDLFKGLALDKLTDIWDPRPVLHLDLNNGLYSDIEGLLSILNYNLDKWEQRYVDEKCGENVSERFSHIIRSAFEKTGRKVAILIDEYDKPLLSAFGNETLASELRTILKSFYSNLKTMDRYIEIAVVTGVARFSQVSIFSDLNNLRDISFDDNFASICGVTSEELTEYFEDGIRALAEKNGKETTKIIAELKENYDGYHFAEQSPDIYNPFSLMNVFAANKIGSYWFKSATPSYLVKLIEKTELNLPDLVPWEIDRDELESAGILSGDPIPAFYQTGYLTIKSYDDQFETYTLDYPNREVKQGFIKFLVPYYLSKTTGDNKNSFNLKKFVDEVNQGRVEDFMKSLESLIANIPYSEKGTGEDHFRTAIYMLFTLMGYYARMEERVASGRMDLAVETDRYVYIFEFKIDRSAAEAIAQIRERRYWAKYQSSAKQIYLIGANFNTKSRHLDSYLIEHP